MESVYLLERTWADPYRFLRPSFIRSRPGTRPSIPPIDTLTARARFNPTPNAPNRADESPETPSPRSPAEHSTPNASPSTTFTTPEASPVQAKLGKLVDGIMELNLTKEAEVESLLAQVDVWKERHMALVIRERQLEEQLYQNKERAAGRGD